MPDTKQPNKRTLLFLCTKCNKEVFRAGIRVNQENKLCGKCNGRVETTLKDIDVLPQLTLKQSLVVEDKETPVTQLGSISVSDVQVKVKHYKARLDKVLELLTTNPNESFYSLWGRTE